MYSHRVHFTAADRLIETRTSRLTIIRSHYDVDINPVVKVVSQKKPKSCCMLSGNSLKEQEGDWADAFAACTFDGRKNCFTPVAFPMAIGERYDGSQTQLTSASTYPLVRFLYDTGERSSFEMITADEHGRPHPPS
jgi:hypothetical protein